MRDPAPNGRTHEPTLRELTAELDGLEALLLSEIRGLTTLVNERHNFYAAEAIARKEAVNAALLAVEKQTASSFMASEKAIVKAEDAQRQYNQTHNDLSRKMDEQYKTMVPHSEARLKWDGFDKIIDEIRKELAALRESRSQVTGRDEGKGASTATTQWVLGFGIAAAGFFLSVAILLIQLLPLLRAMK